MCILEISNLKYSETFDANCNVSKITSLSLCCKYRDVTVQTKVFLLTQFCRKRCPQVKNKTKQNLSQVLTTRTFK